MPAAAGEGKEEFGDEPQTRLGLHGQGSSAPPGAAPLPGFRLVSGEAARASPARVLGCDRLLPVVLLGSHRRGHVAREPLVTDRRE